MNKYKSYLSGGYSSHYNEYAIVNNPPNTFINGPFPVGYSIPYKLSWNEYDEELKLFKNEKRNSVLIRSNLFLYRHQQNSSKVVDLIGSSSELYFNKQASVYDVIGGDEGLSLISLETLNSQRRLAQINSSDLAGGLLVFPSEVGKHLYSGIKIYIVPTQIAWPNTLNIPETIPARFIMVDVANDPPTNFTSPPSRTLFFENNGYITSITEYNFRKVYGSGIGAFLGYGLAPLVVTLRKLSDTDFQFFPYEGRLDFTQRQKNTSGFEKSYKPPFFNNPKIISEWVLSSEGANCTYNIYTVPRYGDYKDGERVAVVPCDSYYPSANKFYHQRGESNDIIWNVHNGTLGAIKSPMFASWLDSRYVNLNENTIEMQETCMAGLDGSIGEYPTGTKIQLKTPINLKPYSNFSSLTVNYVFSDAVNIYSGLILTNGVQLVQYDNVLLLNEDNPKKNRLFQVRTGAWYELWPYNASAPALAVPSGYWFGKENAEYFRASVYVRVLTARRGKASGYPATRVFKLDQPYNFYNVNAVLQWEEIAYDPRWEKIQTVGNYSTAETHGSGLDFLYLRSLSELPSGLEENGEYYLIKNGSLISFALTYENALLGVKIPLVTMGKGMICIYNADYARNVQPKIVTSVDPLVEEDLDLEKVYYLINNKYGIRLAQTKDKALAGEFLDIRLEPNTQYALEKLDVINQRAVNLSQDGKNFSWNPESTSAVECMARPNYFYKTRTNAGSSNSFYNRSEDNFSRPVIDTVGEYTSDIQMVSQTTNYPLGFFLYSYVAKRNIYLLDENASGYTAVYIYQPSRKKTASYSFNGVTASFGPVDLPPLLQGQTYVKDINGNNITKMEGIIKDETDIQNEMLKAAIQKLNTAEFKFYYDSTPLFSDDNQQGYNRVNTSYSPYIDVPNPKYASLPFAPNEKRYVAYKKIVVILPVTGTYWVQNVTVSNYVTSTLVEQQRAYTNHVKVDLYLKATLYIDQATNKKRAVIIMGGPMGEGKKTYKADDNYFVNSAPELAATYADNFIPNSFTISEGQLLFPTDRDFTIEFDGAVIHTWRKFTALGSSTNVSDTFADNLHESLPSSLVGSIVCAFSAVKKRWLSQPLISNGVNFKVEVMADDGVVRVFGCPNSSLNMTMRTLYEEATSYINGCTQTFLRRSNVLFKDHFTTEIGKKTKPYRLAKIATDYYTYNSQNYLFQYYYSNGDNLWTDVPNNGCELAILDPLVNRATSSFFYRAIYDKEDDSRYSVLNTTQERLLGFISTVTHFFRTGLAAYMWVTIPTLTVFSNFGSGASIQLVTKSNTSTGGPNSYSTSPTHFPSNYITASAADVVEGGKLYNGYAGLADYIALNGNQYFWEKVQSNPDYYNWVVKATVIKLSFNTLDYGSRLSANPPTNGLAYTDADITAIKRLAAFAEHPWYPKRIVGKDLRWELPQCPSPAALGVISKLGFDLPAPPALIPTPPAPAYTETIVS